MARTLGNDDEERYRRIKLVVDYIRDGFSIRKIKELFDEEHNITISIATISDYARRGKKMFGNSDVIDSTFYKNNKDKLVFHDGTINEEVKMRVVKEAKLYYVEGYNLEEISNELNIPYHVVYRDLKEKLPRINSELAENVKKMMSDNRLDNLEKNNKIKG